MPLYQWAIGSKKSQFNGTAGHNIFACPTVTAQGIDPMDMDPNHGYMEWAAPAVRLRDEFKSRGQREIATVNVPHAKAGDGGSSFRLRALFRRPQPFR